MSELSDMLKQIAGVFIIGVGKFVKLLIDFAFLLEEPFSTLGDVVTGLADSIQKAIDKIEGLLGIGDDEGKPGVVDIVFNPATVLSSLLSDGKTGPQGTARRGPGAREAGEITPEEQAAIDHWVRLGTITGDVGVVAGETADAKEKEKSAADEAKESVDDLMNFGGRWTIWSAALWDWRQMPRPNSQRTIW
jgi:hypothetical protein